MSPMASHSSANANEAPTTGAILLPRVIAHGGGDVRGVRVSNSLQALEEQYTRGVRFFEIDISWTSDGHLVCLHDWLEETLPTLFNVEAGWRSLREFEGFTMVQGLQQLTFLALTRWLDAHPDVYVVADVKDSVVFAMQRMLALWPRAKERIIPQAHSIDDFTVGKHMGYLRVFFTNYLAKYDHRALFAFAMIHRINGLVLWDTHALATDLVQACRQIGVRVFAHTVNDAATRDQLFERGVFGIYSDCLF